MLFQSLMDGKPIRSPSLLTGSSFFSYRKPGISLCIYISYLIIIHQPIFTGVVDSTMLYRATTCGIHDCLIDSHCNHSRSIPQYTSSSQPVECNVNDSADYDGPESPLGNAFLCVLEIPWDVYSCQDTSSSWKKDCKYREEVFAVSISWPKVLLEQIHI